MLQESGENEEMRERHALHFMMLAEEAEPELIGPRQLDWFRLLEDEHDNIRAALDWYSVAKADPGGKHSIERGLRLAGAISRFWRQRGYFSEGRERLDRLLTKADAIRLSSKSLPYKAKALGGAGVLAAQQGDYAAADALLRRGLDLHCKAGNKRGIGLALNRLADIMYRRGDDVAVQEYSEESLSLFEELGDEWGKADALQGLALAASLRDDREAWRSFSEESLELFRESRR